MLYTVCKLVKRLRYHHDQKHSVDYHCKMIFQGKYNAKRDFRIMVTKIVIYNEKNSHIWAILEKVTYSFILRQI